MRYKKKIYTIRAMQWTGRNIDTLQAFIANMVPYQINNDGSLSIQTLEGILTYPAGAVLVRGKKGLISFIKGWRKEKESESLPQFSGQPFSTAGTQSRV